MTFGGRGGGLLGEEFFQVGRNEKILAGGGRGRGGGPNPPSSQENPEFGKELGHPIIVHTFL